MTNPKLQAPNPKQLPTPKLQLAVQVLEFGMLGVPWSLELGAWDLIRPVEEL
jgi:hypothetical protein